MANLVESNDYPTGIYQLETTDPVIGGPPNEATKAGVDNIPHQQLAKRTNWLKTRVDQLLDAVGVATKPAAEAGADNAGVMTPLRVAQAIRARSQTSQSDVRPDLLLVQGAHGLGASPALSGNLNAVTVTGWVRYDGTTQNRPTAAVSAGVVQTVWISATRAAQVAWSVSGQTGPISYMRVLHSGGWGAWVEVVTRDSYTGLHAAAGWQRLPSGLIMQWGRSAENSNAVSGTSVVTFPIAWPTACYALVCCDISNDGNKSAASAGAISQTTAALHWHRVAGTNHQGIRWFAVGV